MQRRYLNKEKEPTPLSTCMYSVPIQLLQLVRTVRCTVGSMGQNGPGMDLYR